ncbi:MAG: glucose-1-phosphate adenylyltransferase [Chloroflexota bacterium]|nr:glucose-1-phosphate adenylyltransferase [Chloroflexota bacterium]MDQ5866173.1 glucose-1-phosphate adenylyltransferase [Chloroflexota bacterium]
MSKVLAVILAGGQGERLSLLSEKRAKPAVPFAGKYRIIDFALSNCVNSGIYDVAILTQYRPHSLNDHIGIGKPWDLDRRHGGVHLLQPYVGREESDWYQGTADAVYQNLTFIMESRADYVLVLAGDHIYRMDYRPMIEFHQQRRADATLGAVVVPIEEGHRFGILDTDIEGRVITFEEKPAKPKGTLGSMGIYVFDRETLARVLLEDARLEASQHDFGRNIIPNMLARGERVFAYPFTGYWQDVGTIQSYWEAHMELLDDHPAFDLYDSSWVIHTLSEERPPAYVTEGCHVTQSLISHGCRVRGSVERSVLSPGVVVEEGAVVRDSIVLFDTVIGAGSVVDRSILDKEVVVGKNCRIGHGDDMTPNKQEPGRLNTGITLVGKRSRLPDNLTVGRNCKIGTDLRPQDFKTDTLESGDSVEDRGHGHGWERDLVRQAPAAAATPVAEQASR